MVWNYLRHISVCLMHTLVGFAQTMLRG